MSYTSFVYDLPEDDTSPLGTLNVVIGLFFDGTRNNRNNTNARQKYFELKDPKNKTLASNEDKEHAGAYADNGNKDDDSYENDLSNIAILESYYPRQQTETCIIDHIYKRYSVDQE